MALINMLKIILLFDSYILMIRNNFVFFDNS